MARGGGIITVVAEAATNRVTPKVESSHDGTINLFICAKKKTILDTKFKSFTTV